MTILELLLNHLPERYVDRVVSNVPNRNILHEEGFDISAEMLSLFDWNMSREGYEFWDEVLEAIEKNLPLPKLPLVIDYAPNTNFIIGENEWSIMNAGGLNINMRFEFDVSHLKSYNNIRKYEILLSFLN